MSRFESEVSMQEPSANRRVLGLFAKLWQPGKVKTRLAATIGAQRAAAIYQQLLIFHLKRFGDSADARAIAYSPSDDATKARFADRLQSLNLQELAGSQLDWNLVPQTESDLGTRMCTFFQQQFDSFEGACRVIVVGSDAPQLTTAMVDEAFGLLDSHDVVFGPSTDGGYYLIGLRVMTTEIFQGIAWSTDSVLAESLIRCKTAGLSVAELRQQDPLTDIDEEADLHQVMESLRNEPCELSRQLVRELNRILGASS